MRLLTLLLLTPLVAGCDVLGSGDGDISARTDRASYGRSSVAVVTLRNGTDRVLLYETCSGWALEAKLRSTGEWTLSDGHACTQGPGNYEQIRPGRSLRVELPVEPSAVIAGGTQVSRYRFVLLVDRAKDGEAAGMTGASNTFDVQL